MQSDFQSAMADLFKGDIADVINWQYMRLSVVISYGAEIKQAS